MNLGDGALHANCAAAGTHTPEESYRFTRAGANWRIGLARQRTYYILVHSSNHLPGREFNTSTPSCQWPENPTLAGHSRP